MTTLTFHDACDVYDRSQNVAFRYHRIPFQEITALVRSRRQLWLTLGDASQDDFWREVLAKVSWYLHQCSMAALPFSHPALRGSMIVEDLKGLLAHVQQIAPDFAAPATNLLNHLQALASSSNNPMLEAIAALLDRKPTSNMGLVTAYTRFVEPTESEIRRHQTLQGMEVVRPTELSDEWRYERLFVVGPVRAYGERDFILTAPRASQIDVVRYSVIRDNWKPARFARPRMSPTQPSWREPRVEDSADAELLDVQLYTPDIAELLRRLAPADPRQRDDMVDSVLVTLMDERLVFLDADEDSWALGINVHEEGSARVQRIQPVRRIEPGMFLLLRTQGVEGNYIVSVADRILGSRASEARAAQKLWKDHLRAKVDERGILAVVDDLNALGVERASYQNVRGWISYRSICTQHFSDFKAILGYTGLITRAEEIWALMHEIRRAHTKAGQRIRQLLLEQVERADLRVLQRQGIMEFELAEEEFGALTAFRVDSVSSQTCPAPASRLGHPFEAEALIWRA